MIDRELVTRKLALVIADLKALAPYAAKPLEGFLESDLDYYESFTQLAKIGALPAAFASQIAGCAGLRNRLVHEYDDIDPARVHEAAGSALRDVPLYLRLVREFVDAAQPGS